MNDPKSEFRNSKLSDHNYELFRDLILARTGMLFGPRQRDALTRGMLAAAERADCENLGEYHHLLQEARTDSDLWDDLIGAITVGETYFFRNPSHFDALRQHILPPLIACHQDDRRLRIWSAGCSTGEEAYSVAILLRQILPDIADWNVFILATDINKRALQQAREGRYREWSFRQTAPAIRRRYFTPRDGNHAQDRPFGGAQACTEHSRSDKLFDLSPQVREMVTFAYLNLAEDAYPSLATNTNAMDLILCRNVAIYLPEAVTRKMAERFHRCLVTDGWLIVGASETNSMVYGQFAARNCSGATLYQKARRREDTETWGGRAPHPRVAPSLPLPIPLPPPPSVRPSVPSTECIPRPVPSETRPEPLLRTGMAEGEAEGPGEGLAQDQQAHAADPYQEGLALMRQGHYEEAMTHFLDCMVDDPGFAPAYYQMARVHANRGRLEEARSWCQQAIEQDPLLTEAHYILALIHQEEGALDEAIARLKKALYLDSDFVLARFGLANLYQQAGRQDEATLHRAQAIRLAAKMPPDDVVPGSDDLTAGRLLTMVRATM